MQSENLTGLDPEILRTKGKVIAELFRDRTPIVDACKLVQLSTKSGHDYKTETIEKPCDRIDGPFCGACAFPNIKWKLGLCNLATHLEADNRKDQPHQFITPITMDVEKVEENKKFLNPIKNSKRGNR
jgi:hypothetical protein